MTSVSGDLAGGSAARDFARDWQGVRADGDIQYAPVEMPKPRELPAWLQALSDFLKQAWNAFLEFFGAFGVSSTVIIWILVAIGVALAALLIWRILSPGPRLRRQPEIAEPEWAPDAAEALGLLEDADQLAAQGRFDEAAHLLLQRTVVQIREARPGLLEPSSTAREISTMPALPEAARRAFGVIAGRVEMSLFALRGLNAEDWQAARSAYAQFALAAPQAPE